MKRSWIGKGFQIASQVQTSYYDTIEGRTLSAEESERILVEEWKRTNGESVGVPGRYFTMLDGTPSGCVNIALHHLDASQEIDLVISGPNLGRNSSAASSLSSGTVGAALDAALVGRKAIALSFAFYNRDTLTDPSAISNACDSAIEIIESLWTQWPSPSTGSTSQVPDLYNVNIPLVPPPKRKVYWTTFQAGGYESLYKQLNKPKPSSPNSNDPTQANGDATQPVLPVYTFSPRFNRWEDAVEGSDQWAVKNQCISITPMKAMFQSLCLL
ncbi:hypothetical protein HDV05_005725 [Chytridiales sp. JEL 0842]|nr:hypothetical protein HDV05_005725 [Chytridiales sp. JEL 0842]